MTTWKWIALWHAGAWMSALVSHAFDHHDNTDKEFENLMIAALVCLFVWPIVVYVLSIHAATQGVKKLRGQK